MRLSLKYYAFYILQIILDIALYNLAFSFIHLTLRARLFLTGTMVACFLFKGLYDFRRVELWDEAIAVLRFSVLIMLVNMLYVYTERLGLPLWKIAVCVALFVPLTLAGRYFLRRWLFGLGLLSKSVIIIVAGKTGENFARNFAESSFTVSKVLGFLDDDPDKQGCMISGYPVLGKIEDFGKLQEQLKADEAIISITTLSQKRLAEILTMLEEKCANVMYIPDVYMMAATSASVHSIDGMPVVSASQPLKKPVFAFIKRVMDCVGAVIALLVFSPFMIWAAYRIKKEDGGSVLFIQERTGWKAQHFKTYKFRTMHMNADEITRELFKNPEILAGYKEGIKLKDDPRLTKIGAILRKTSIDELPQLFNILRGEMSLVGPRPLAQFDVDIVYNDEYILRKVYTAKPGLTGIWQVSGRSDLDADFRRKINCYYAQNWSLWLDIVILLKTPLAVLMKKGAY